ncbi:MAG: nucleotide exchange factor GrpE [Candidatus Peribacteraceae bacterium]|nr:nucleotide exchange factor GrpE [Candidatus Peribacteraceae bacterium]
MKDENQIPLDDSDLNEDPQSNPPQEGSPSANDFEEKYLRALAELENFRKQVERDKTDLAKFANENCLSALLPVLDNFKRAAAHLPEGLKKNEWASGVSSIEKQFEATLTDLGLRRIEAKTGDPVDVNRHEAIATGAGESGIILEVIEDGYELNGKVLRAAKVRVGE